MRLTEDLEERCVSVDGAFDGDGASDKTTFLHTNICNQPTTEGDDAWHDQPEDG